ncbi:MAG TPA: hypothetical protein VFT04_03410 [Gemmatimonadales bacterium]|nr:hypothetical protein [Gemmatimonadales bacterium]
MPEPSFRQLVTAALLCATVAASLVWAGLTRSDALQVPPAVAYLVASILVSAALALLAKAARRPRLVNWLIVVILGGFAIVGGWIALDDTADACRVAAGGRDPGGGGFGCRTAFGLGALMNAGMTIWAARLARRSTDGA